MRDFGSTKRFIVLVVLLVALLAMMVFAGSVGSVTTPGQQFFVSAFTPITEITRAVTRNVTSFVSRYADVGSLSAENLELKAEISRLREELSDTYSALDEKEHEELAQLVKNREEEYDLLDCAVTARDPLGQFGDFTIDRGANDGVTVGDAVVAEYGLCGVVYAVTDNYSTVRTVLHPELNISAKVTGKSEIGIVVGDLQYASDGMTTLTLLPKDTSVSVGDLVVTTGDGGVLPPDFIIGTIDSLHLSSDGRTNTAIVESLEDLRRIETVFVVRN